MSSHSGLPGIFDWALGIKGEAKECRRDLEKLPKDSVPWPGLLSHGVRPFPPELGQGGVGAWSHVLDDSGILSKPLYLPWRGRKLTLKMYSVDSAGRSWENILPWGLGLALQDALGSHHGVCPHPAPSAPWSL